MNLHYDIVESKGRVEFYGFETLYKHILDIEYQLICFKRSIIRLKFIPPSQKKIWKIPNQGWAILLIKKKYQNMYNIWFTYVTCWYLQLF